jgi:hypothetical protein
MIDSDVSQFDAEILELLLAGTDAYLDLLESAKAAIQASGAEFLRDQCQAAALRTECGTPAAIRMAVEDELAEQRPSNILPLASSIRFGIPCLNCGKEITDTVSFTGDPWIHRVSRLPACPEEELRSRGLDLRLDYRAAPQHGNDGRILVSLLPL